DAHLVSKGWQLGKVDTAPGEPGGQAREPDATNLRDSLALAQARETSDGLVRKAPRFPGLANGGGDVGSGDRAFADRVLRGRGIETLAIRGRYRSAVAQRKDIGMIEHLKLVADLERTVLALGQVSAMQGGIDHDATRPDHR